MRERPDAAAQRPELAMAQKNAEPITSVEHIPSTEHGRGFPPFDAQTFASQLFWLTLAFVALYLLMSRIALPRVASILEARRQRVESDLAEAQRLKGASDAAIAAHEKALAEARTRAQALANETREKAAAAAELRRKEVDAKLNARIAEAEKTIAATRSAAMTNVHGIASDIVPAIVERLIGIAPPSKEVAEAVSNALKR
jgi:F-type H+-transporting ATPase subunit b